MASATRIIRGAYRDSIALMRLSAAIAELPGVEQASLVMATPANLDLLREAGLLEGVVDARPSDVLIAVRGTGDKALAAAFDAAARGLAESAAAATGGGAPGAIAPRSAEMALAAAPRSNLALVSVPGEYAAAEATKALRLGLHVMLFSDNVALADEIALKALARERGLLVMGPDCGTAIVNGVPLGFANVVRRGAIGCIGASGTGLQQVTCLIDQAGQGVSHAIGAGGRDLAAEVGGATTLAALAMLGADPATRVIVLVSKPPAPGVARTVLAAARVAGKPVVACFVGAEARAAPERNVHHAPTLADAARVAAALAAGQKPAASARWRAPARLPRTAAGQRYVRALYSGGTFAYEASHLLGALLGEVRSNAPVREELALADPWASVGHTVVDLGADEFTRGRAHPMIDHRLRNERLVREAADPEVAVLLFDVVLGHGSHADPALAIAPALRAARAAAAKRRQPLALVGFVCGTAGDPQGLERQTRALAEAGVILGASNAEAVRIAAAIARRAAAGVAASTRGARKRPPRKASAARRAATRKGGKR